MAFQILHSSIDSVERIHQSGSGGSDNGNSISHDSGSIGGSLVIRCKDLKIIQLDIRASEKFKSIAESLEKLSSATHPLKDNQPSSKISFDQLVVNTFAKVKKSKTLKC